MLNISRLATSLLQSVPDAVSKAPGIKDFHFANSIVQGAKLRMSGSWLNDQKARLNPGQMRFLNVAMAAIGGHEAVSDIRQDDMGGHFNLARPSYGAASVAYQREKPFSDILSFLGVNDLHGKSLLSLGAQHLMAAAGVQPAAMGYHADEASILAHSCHDPSQAWQKNMFRVPFLTSQGQRVKVVGDYLKGNAERFEVKNKAGKAYALLNRLKLAGGELVWVLSSSLDKIDSYLRNVKQAGVNSLKDIINGSFNAQSQGSQASSSMRPSFSRTDYEAKLNNATNNGQPAAAEGPKTYSQPRPTREEYEARINNEPQAEQPAAAEEPKAYSKPRPTREEYEARLNNEPKAEQPAEAEEPKAYSKPRPTREEYEARLNNEPKAEQPAEAEEPKAYSKPRPTREEYEARLNNEPKAEQPAEAEEPKAYSKPRPTREEYEARLNNEPKAEQPAEAEEPKAYSKPRPTREEYEAKINREQKTEESAKPQGTAEEPTKVLGDTPPKPEVKPLYSHLGLENNASFDEVKKAYRKAALKNHPDKNLGNVEAQAAFQEAQNAYEILSSPEKRKAYDSGAINEKGQFENGTMFREAE